MAKYDFISPGELRVYRANPGNDPELIQLNKTIDKGIWNLLTQITHEFFFSSKHVDHESGIRFGNYLEREWRIPHEPPQGSHVQFAAKDIGAIFYTGGISIKNRILNDPELNATFGKGFPPLQDLTLKKYKKRKPIS